MDRVDYCRSRKYFTRKNIGPEDDIDAGKQTLS
jgi:hypothetical protein